MTDHEFTPAERAEIADLPAPKSALTADDVLAASRKPKNNRPLYGLAMAAVALLTVAGVYGSGLLEDDGRTRGTPRAPAIHLQAAAEGVRGIHPLKDGSRVAIDERVLFQVVAAGPGWLHLEEGVTTMGKVEKISGGTYTPGGDRPQSWRPDKASGVLTYSAWLCPDEGPPSADRCSTDTLKLDWERR